MFFILNYLAECLPEDKLNIVDSFVVEQRRANFNNSLRTFNSILLRIVKAEVILMVRIYFFNSIPLHIVESTSRTVFVLVCQLMS